MTSKILAVIITFMVTASSIAQEKKVASPAETATGKINGATITINYGSPSVKGRTIYGKLVPIDEIWRAGANEATTFETDKDITVAGQKLPAGKYSLFVIPNKHESTVIFNKDSKQWGATKYDQKQDALRIKVIPVASDPTEKLIYKINNDNVTLSWHIWNFPIPIK